jgi:hypothetical protein
VALFFSRWPGSGTVFNVMDTDLRLVGPVSPIGAHGMLPSMWS